MEIHQQLRHQLKEAAERNKADGILLSAGLDSSILAILARPRIAFTVALKDSKAPDVSFAETVSNLVSIELKTNRFTQEEAMKALPEVIRILKTFDLALPNDLSIYFGFKLAKENDIDSVMTGDGSDELFAGYSYMVSLSPGDLERYIRQLSKNWHFSADHLGKAMRVEVKQPFLDQDLVRFALDVSPQLKIKEGIGKYILRKSLENLIPPEVVWREKEPIE